MLGAAGANGLSVAELQGPRATDERQVWPPVIMGSRRGSRGATRTSAGRAAARRAGQRMSGVGRRVG